MIKRMVLVAGRSGPAHSALLGVRRWIATAECHSLGALTLMTHMVKTSLIAGPVCYVRAGNYTLTLQANADGNIESVKPRVVSLAQALITKLR